jgi:hypothetical protein
MNETGVFLSYAREDKATAEKILHALEARRFPVFFDQYMPSGVEWERALKAQLQRAYAVVVLWSSHAAASEWVTIEVAAGLEKGRLFPILIEPGVILPSSFQHLQVADLSDWKEDPDDPKFGQAIVHLEVLWDSQVGTRQDIQVRKPLRLITRPASSST